MPQSLTTSPAHTVLPGTIVNKDSVVYQRLRPRKEDRHPLY